jgi:hypothetical protein
MDERHRSAKCERFSAASATVIEGVFAIRSSVVF